MVFQDIIQIFDEGFVVTIQTHGVDPEDFVECILSGPHAELYAPCHLMNKDVFLGDCWLHQNLIAEDHIVVVHVISNCLGPELDDNLDHGKDIMLNQILGYCLF